MDQTRCKPTDARRVSAAEEKVIVFLKTAGEGASTECVANHLKMGVPQSELILVFMEEQGLIRSRHAAAVSMMALPHPTKWTLTAEGKRYLTAHDLPG